MNHTDNLRPLENGIVRDLRGQLNYSQYLKLSQLLSCQQPLSEPVQHDEVLFILQHQVAELWMKLLIHELSAAIQHVRQDHLERCFKILSRVKLVQMQLFDMWGVLETMTPSEYMEFRGVLGHASGFQSPQYRKLEFLLGNKNRDTLAVFAHEPETHAELTAALESPSLYDEFLRHLARRGLPVPVECTERDWSQPYRRNEAVVDLLTGIYQQPELHWDAYEMCEKAGRCRGVFPALALPPPQDRGTYHRLQDRHRRLFRGRIPAPRSRPDLLSRTPGRPHPPAVACGVLTPQT